MELAAWSDSRMLRPDYDVRSIVAGYHEWIGYVEGVDPLHLDELNRVTLAWAEWEYNRKRHSEIGCPPIQRMVGGPDVSREAPESDAVRLAFSAQCARPQRRSDGTLSI